MKTKIFLLLAIVLIGCNKKQTNINCYTCTNYVFGTTPFGAKCWYHVSDTVICGDYSSYVAQHQTTVYQMTKCK